MVTVIPDEEVFVSIDNGPFTTLFAIGEAIPTLTSFQSPFTTILVNYPITLPEVLIHISPPCGTDGGGSGECQDDRPDTGMLYPRG